MRTILIANPKGGSGKTTLATNIAGWLAGKRQKVALLDEDPQRSATHWLASRPPLFPPIAGFTDKSGKKELKQVAPEWLVIDSPAGLHGEALHDALRRADAMIVPVSPSAFDMAATKRFFSAIADYKQVREGVVPIALVAMRVDVRTNVSQELDDFLKGLGQPVVAHLRTTQTYVHCARDGLSVFDLPRSRGEQDQEQWRPLTRWIARHAAVRGD